MLDRFQFYPAKPDSLFTERKSGVAMRRVLASLALLVLASCGGDYSVDDRFEGPEFEGNYVGDDPSTDYYREATEAEAEAWSDYGDDMVAEYGEP